MNEQFAERPNFSRLDQNLELPTQPTLKERIAFLTIAGVAAIPLTLLGIVTLKEILSH